jgi:uncharacterized protein YraI
MMHFARLAGGILAAGLATAIVLIPSAALAKPATTVNYGVSANASRYAGAAFDTCAAPPLTTMQAWTASPYRVIGVYIGGVNRTCQQTNLTASWVAAASRLSWRFLLIYKGLQPACGGKVTDQKISLNLANAASQGTAAANDADAQRGVLGLAKGSAIYNDIEHYTTTDTACRNSVLTYLSAWTTRLHQLGDVAGAYMNLNLGARDLSAVYSSAAYARPDALWIARYDESRALTGWAGIPGQQWSTHQRAKQYRGTHNETYGGVTLSIDNDQLDAPIATLKHPYSVTSVTGVNARSGPGTSYPVVRSYPASASVQVVCQTSGSKVGTTRVWDKLPDGSYVTDYYVSTPSNTAFSGLSGPCMYAYQVTPGGGANVRSGPGASYSLTGHLNSGALAWVACQRAGSRIGTTRVWDQIRDYNGGYVSDYYVATPNKTTYSGPIPRC